MYFAFASLIKNDVTYAKKARDMILYVMKKYMQNKGSLPFGQASFATYDRSRWWGEAFPLTYDWVQFWPGVWTPAGKSLVCAYRPWLLISPYVSIKHASLHYFEIPYVDVRRLSVYIYIRIFMTRGTIHISDTRLSSQTSS